MRRKVKNKLGLLRINLRMDRTIKQRKEVNKRSNRHWIRSIEKRKNCMNRKRERKRKKRKRKSKYMNKQ